MARSVTRQRVSRAASRLQQYLVISSEIAALSKRKTDLRDEMIELIDADHEKDPEKGHLTQNLGTPITLGNKTYEAIQRQRKVSQVFDEDKAIALLKSKEIEETEYLTPVLDQDKVARLYADDVLTDDEFDGLFEEVESYSFVAVKA